MPNNRQFRISNLTVDERNMALWPQVIDSDVKPNLRARYHRNVAAVTYLLGAGPGGQKVTGVGYRHAHDLLQRALKLAPDGRIYGFRALIPWTHTKGDYERVKPETRNVFGRGKAGLFIQLLKRYPVIEDLIKALYLKYRRSKGSSRLTVHESRILVKGIYKQVHALCTKLVPAGQYPHTTRYGASEAVRRYVLKLDDLHFERVVAERHGEEAARHARRGGEGSVAEHVRRLFQRVEMDAYTVDAEWILRLTAPAGLPVDVDLKRITLLAARETVSGASLGYHIVFRPQVSAADVLACVWKCISPWSRRTLTTPGLEYAPHAGFPCGLLPQLQWAIFGELSLDRALAHLANDVRMALEEPPLSIRITWGRTADPDRRAGIESLFHELAANGFQRLPNTTGHSPDDPRRRRPVDAARKLDLDIRVMCDFTEVLLANFNAMPSDHADYRSPLEFLHEACALPDFSVRTLPVAYRQTLGVRWSRERATVRGDPSNGLRPYIEKYYARYTNRVLARMPGLIGTNFTIDFRGVNGDARTVMAYFEDGKEFGILTVKGKWARVPHTIEERQLAYKRRIRRHEHYVDAPDPVSGMLNALSDIVTKKRRKGKKTGEDVGTSDGRIPYAANRLAESFAWRIERGLWPSDHVDSVEVPQTEHGAKSDVVPDTSPVDALWRSIIAEDDDDDE